MQKKRDLVRRRQLARKNGCLIDITGTPLKPSPQGRACPGNGEDARYECCCDECDYFLYCFPEYRLDMPHIFPNG